MPIQSPDILPLPNMSTDNAGDRNGYLRLAIHQAKKTTEAFLSSIRELTTTHTHKPTRPSNKHRTAPTS